MRPPLEPGSQAEGFILPTVLWVLALLSLTALAIGAAQRLHVRAQANLVTAERARLLADGATRSIALNIASGRLGALGRSGAEIACRDGATRYDIVVTDVAGLVDLNASPFEELAVLLRGLRVEPKAAANLALAIIDARDADDTTQSGEAENDAYAKADLPFGAKNLPFESTSELDQVPGMTPQLLARIEPFATVYSRRPKLDPRLAPPSLRQTLQAGRGEKDVAVQVHASETRSRIQDVRVDVRSADGARAARHAIVEVDGRSARGFRFHEWRAPAALSTTERTVIDALECQDILQ